MSDQTITIKHLPDDIITEVYAFLPHTTRFSLNKKEYQNSIDDITAEMIQKNCFHRYIKHVIRKDYISILSRYLSICHLKWETRRNWFEMGMTHASYLHFLQHFALIHDSSRCYQEIKNIISQQTRQPRQSLNDEW